MVHKTIRKVLKKETKNKRTLKKNIKKESIYQFGGVDEKQEGLYNRKNSEPESAIEQTLRASRSGLTLKYPGDVNQTKNNAIQAKNEGKRYGFTDFANDSDKKTQSQLEPKFFYKNIYPTYLISHILETPSNMSNTGIGQSSNNNENNENNQSTQPNQPNQPTQPTI